MDGIISYKEDSIIGRFTLILFAAGRIQLGQGSADRSASNKSESPIVNVNQGHQQQRVFVTTLCSFTRILIARIILHRESTQELVQNEKFIGPMRVRLAPSVERTLGTSTILVIFPVEGQFQAPRSTSPKTKTTTRACTM